jgi:hypothetical protein
LAVGFANREIYSLASGRPHLRECQRCFADLSLALAAIEAGRARQEWPAWLQRLLTPARAIPVAAALLALAALVVLGPVRRVPDRFQVRGDQLTGVQTIEAGTELLVESSTVSAGASVTLRSGSVVALGEGFSVQENGRLGIQVKTGSAGRGS